MYLKEVRSRINVQSRIPYCLFGENALEYQGEDNDYTYNIAV